MSHGQGVSGGFQVTMVEGHCEQNTTTREKIICRRYLTYCRKKISRKIFLRSH